MRELAGRCAVVTGGGGLLGRGMVHAFAAAGMDVVVADLDLTAAQSVAATAASTGVRALAVQTDVTDVASVEALADAAYEHVGAVHLLCNNAGLAILKPFEELTRSDWDRVLAVQLGGVVNGVQTFLPRLLDGGEEGHIVNVSSMSGVGLARLRHMNAPYVSAKFAVVGLTEALAASLEGGPVGASVLCPGWTVPDPAAVTSFPTPSARWYQHNLLRTEDVAREVVHGVRENRLHIFPHRAGRREVEDRQRMLLAAFDQAAATSPPEAG